jgi:DNA-binding transcriptional MerR regulator
MNIRELSDASGVSVRNIKLYIAERLLAPPTGRTRGAVYSEVHKRELLQIRALHEQGFSVERIRQVRGRGDSGGDVSHRDPAVGCSVARVYKLADGIELTISEAALASAAEESVVERCRAIVRAAAHL